MGAEWIEWVCPIYVMPFDENLYKSLLHVPIEKTTQKLRTSVTNGKIA